MQRATTLQTKYDKLAISFATLNVKSKRFIITVVLQRLRFNNFKVEGSIWMSNKVHESLLRTEKRVTSGHFSVQLQPRFFLNFLQ